MVGKIKKRKPTESFSWEFSQNFLNSCSNNSGRLQQKTVTTVSPDNRRIRRPEVFSKTAALKNSREFPENHGGGVFLKQKLKLLGIFKNFSKQFRVTASLDCKVSKRTVIFLFFFWTFQCFGIFNIHKVTCYYNAF